MKRRVGLIGLSLFLAGVVLASLVYVPASAGDRLKAVPAQAHIVYNNQNPDWFLSFFPMLGKGEDDFSDVWKAHFHALEESPLLVATVPLGGRSTRDTWVAVSELSGANALALRWRLMFFPPDGIHRVRSYAVWSVWKLEHPAVPAWATVRLAITEGLLICSISADSHDIYYLLDTLDGRVASLAGSRRPL